MAICTQPTHQGRFIELPGGAIMDTGTGIEVCRVNVEGLHTFDAADCVKAVLDALNAKWSPIVNGG